MNDFVLTRRFLPLFFSYALGAFADNALRMATIVAIFAAYNTPGATDFRLPGDLGAQAGSLVSIAFTLPIFLFSVVGGWLADRVARHTLIRILKCAEVVLMTLSAVAFALGNAPLLIASLFMMATQSAFFAPVRNAVMPQYFAEDELIRANGYFNAGLFVALILGLSLGGWLVNKPDGRVIVSAILIGAALMGTIAAMFVPQAAAPTQQMRLAAPKFSLEQYAPVLMPMLGIGWFWMIGAISLANLPNFVHDHLGGGDTQISIVQGLFAVGAGVGSVVAGIVGAKLAAPLKLAAYGVAGTVIGSVLIFVFGQTAGGIGVGLGIAMIGTAAANSCFAVPLMAAVQARAPTAVRAQMMGVANTVNGLGATIGAALVPALRAPGISAAGIFLVTALAQAALLAFIYSRRAALLRNAARPVAGDVAFGPLTVQSADDALR